MFEDDDTNKPNTALGFKNLEFMSVEELDEYINELKAEILRAETDRERKKLSREQADGIFKS